MIHNRQLFIHPSPSQPLSARRLSADGAVPILDEARRDYPLAEALSYCERLARTRYENVPVASRFVPAAMRPHLLAIYAFARAADDFADEPEYAGRRQEALDRWEHELFRTFHGEADHPIFVALRHTVERCDLPMTPLFDLLTAFRMDLVTTYYATFTELRTYCRHGCEPLGHLVLYAFGYRDPALLGFANDLCCGLRLATFLQDLGRDLLRGRLYLPLEDLCHFGVQPETLRALAERPPRGPLPRALRDLMRFQIARARSLLARGRPLLDRVGRDLSFELELTFFSGQAMLDKIESLGFDVLTRRPTLGRADRARVLARAAAQRWPQFIARRQHAGEL